MRVSHASSALSAAFDDPNLVSCAGLAPVVALGQRCGLGELVAAKVTLKGRGGVNADVKVPALVAGMVAGADCIDDMDLLRHGGMDRLFGGVRAPSTLGTFLRTFTHGHVRQLESVARTLLPRLVAHAGLLHGADVVAFVDVDDTVKATHGYAKEDVGFGYSGVRGLNALLATASTPTAAQVIVGTRLRRGSTSSARGAASFLAEALRAAREAGCTGILLARMDSAFYNHKVVAAAGAAGAYFSITARQDTSVRAAIATIPETAWVAIRYPDAVWEEEEQRWISDAEVAETTYTAFTSKAKARQVTARLIVRRVRRLGAKENTGQGELFTAYRYHAVFTDSPFQMLQAESQHRGHAVIEQTHADLRAGPLAHLPSGSFAANAAWLTCAAIAFNLTRAAGALASAFHAKATTATIRAQLITVPARLARSARRVRMHLPRHWPWEHAWTQLFHATLGPPKPA